VIFTIKSFGQNAPVEDTSVKFYSVKSISKFIDSIRAKTISDTSKFNKNDIVLTPKGFINKHSYSPLFFINILFKYKLDIVDGSNVVSFLNEMLVDDKIESITLLEEPKSLKIFGEHGKNGVIMIQMKDISKINLNVAGFKRIRTKGDNFH
jgi:hypothetical protein